MEWWEHKLSPVFAIIYATALLLDLPIITLWPLFLLALVALVPGAAYVSVLNDLTDLADDLASGKNNRLAGKSPKLITAVLACCLVPGIAVAIHWRSDPLLLFLYLAAWTAFSLYSIPPIRLKTRGVLGVLADACGAHLFPTLLVVSLVFRWRAGTLDLVWFAAVGAWSLSYGLRGILWHQLSDLHNDEQAGLLTFVRRHKITRLHLLGNFVIFPVEAAAFAVMLWHIGSALAFVMLGLYALLEWLRRVMWKMNIVIVAPQARYHIVMHEYYEVFFPLALLLTAATRHPPDIVMVVVHFVCFPGRATQAAKDILKLAKQIIRRFI